MNFRVEDSMISLVMPTITYVLPPGNYDDDDGEDCEYAHCYAGY